MARKEIQLIEPISALRSEFPIVVTEFQEAGETRIHDRLSLSLSP